MLQKNTLFGCWKSRDYFNQLECFISVSPITKPCWQKSSSQRMTRKSLFLTHPNCLAMFWKKFWTSWAQSWTPAGSGSWLTLPASSWWLFWRSEECFTATECVAMCLDSFLAFRFFSCPDWFFSTKSGDIQLGRSRAKSNWSRCKPKNNPNLSN